MMLDAELPIGVATPVARGEMNHHEKREPPEAVGGAVVELEIR